MYPYSTMSTNKQERRTIHLKPYVHDELTAFGLKSESYSEVVERLLHIAKNGKIAQKEAETIKSEKEDKDVL